MEICQLALCANFTTAVCCSSIHQIWIRPFLGNSSCTLKRPPWSIFETRGSRRQVNYSFVEAERSSSPPLNSSPSPSLSQTPAKAKKVWGAWITVAMRNGPANFAAPFSWSPADNNPMWTAAAHFAGSILPPSTAFGSCRNPKGHSDVVCRQNYI